MSLFNLGQFTLHSGAQSPFKIDCDALTDADLEALAQIGAQMVPLFGKVEGVPRGGLRLKAALDKYADARWSQLLIVDDVLTTGGSMERQRNGRQAVGLVIFARGPCPSWVTPLFTFAEPQ